MNMQLPRPGSEVRPEVARGFPWLAFAGRIVLRMMSSEEQKTSGGIILPAVTDKSSVTIGGIISVGRGEFIPHVGHVSPIRDHDLHVGDVVMIETNCGHAIEVDGVDYRVVEVFDIVAVLRRDYGKSVREKMLDRIRESSQRHEARGVEAGTNVASARTGTPKSIAMDEDVVREKARTAIGRATRTGAGYGGITTKGRNAGG